MYAVIILRAGNSYDNMRFVVADRFICIFRSKCRDCIQQNTNGIAIVKLITTCFGIYPES